MRLEQLTREQIEDLRVMFDLFKENFNDPSELFVQLLDEVSTLSRKIDEIQKSLKELMKRNEELEKLNRQLAQMVITDPLTGLYNRRFLYEIIEREIARSRRYNTKLSLAVIDLDNFKIINDTYGHIAGDKILISFANILKTTLRKDVDYVFRYGGDEFVILFVGSDSKSAEKVIERIKSSLESCEIKVSFSYGLVDITADSNCEEIIKKADKLMYLKKNKKR